MPAKTTKSQRSRANKRKGKRKALQKRRRARSEKRA